MPLLHIRPSQVDVQLSRTLSRMSQDLLQDGRRATGLNPERSSGVAEEVGSEVGQSAQGKEKAEPLRDSAGSLTTEYLWLWAAGRWAVLVEIAYQVNYIPDVYYQVLVQVAQDPIWKVPRMFPSAGFFHEENSRSTINARVLSLESPHNPPL